MRNIILIVTVISIILLLWVEFKLFPFISCDCNYVKINSIISNLSLAIISASIFYFIDVVLKEKIETQKINPHLCVNLKKLSGITISLLKNIEKSSNEKFSNYPPEKEELVNALIKIPLDSIYDNNRVVKVKWENYIKEIASDTRFYINRLFLFSNHLDTKLTILLDSIYDCNFFDLAFKIAPISTIQQSIKWIDINNMTFYTESINEYLMLIEDLKKEQKKICKQIPIKEV